MDAGPAGGAAGCRALADGSMAAQAAVAMAVVLMAWRRVIIINPFIFG